MTRRRTLLLLLIFIPLLVSSQELAGTYEYFRCANCDNFTITFRADSTYEFIPANGSSGLKKETGTFTLRGGVIYLNYRPVPDTLRLKAVESGTRTREDFVSISVNLIYSSGDTINPYGHLMVNRKRRLSYFIFRTPAEMLVKKGVQSIQPLIPGFVAPTYQATDPFAASYVLNLYSDFPYALHRNTKFLLRKGNLYSLSSFPWARGTILRRIKDRGEQK